jgi:uncharacterized membrane protein
MNAIANILVAVVAALHVYFLALEMFFWTSAAHLKFLQHKRRIRSRNFKWRAALEL